MKNLVARLSFTLAIACTLVIPAFSLFAQTFRSLRRRRTRKRRPLRKRKKPKVTEEIVVTSRPP